MPPKKKQSKKKKKSRKQRPAQYSWPGAATARAPAPAVPTGYLTKFNTTSHLLYNAQSAGLPLNLGALQQENQLRNLIIESSQMGNPAAQAALPALQARYANIVPQIFQTDARNPPADPPPPGGAQRGDLPFEPPAAPPGTPPGRVPQPIGPDTEDLLRNPPPIQYARPDHTNAWDVPAEAINHELFRQQVGRIGIDSVGRYARQNSRAIDDAVVRENPNSGARAYDADADDLTDSARGEILGPEYTAGQPGVNEGRRGHARDHYSADFGGAPIGGEPIGLDVYPGEDPFNQEEAMTLEDLNQNSTGVTGAEFLRTNYEDYDNRFGNVDERPRGNPRRQGVVQQPSQPDRTVEPDRTVTQSNFDSLFGSSYRPESGRTVTQSQYGDLRQNVRNLDLPPRARDQMYVPPDPGGFANGNPNPTPNPNPNPLIARLQRSFGDFDSTLARMQSFLSQSSQSNAQMDAHLWDPYSSDSGYSNLNDAQYENSGEEQKADL